MKKFVEKRLGKLARQILERYQPKIVAITGSVGKTSTKRAIAAVLAEKYKVRTSPANYNTEFGVPLTIIDEPSPGKLAIGWLKVLLKARRLARGKAEFPQVLVLEYGTDKPGDIDYLCDIAPPDVSVVTRISTVHVEHFGSIGKLIEEKAALVRRAKESGAVILNADDELVLAMKDQARAPVMTYGFSAGADVIAANYSLYVKPDLKFEPGETIATTMFTLESEDQQLEVALDNVMGLPAVFSALAAIAVGKQFGLTMDEIIGGLSQFTPMPGRLRILPGIKGSVLIDDSYNAAPASMIAAIDLLREFPMVEDNQRIAALGDMLELGQYSEEEHRRVGQHIVERGIDVLVTAGERAHDIAQAAIDFGMDEDKIHEFKSSQEAGRWLDAKVDPGDVVLIKGSQGTRMEKVTKDLMAEPLKAKDLLVRQYPPWVDMD
ncbi:hypothetical protein KJ910_00155 [Patescibacteria group bacterium]|nr:hypothetical protein [Patescibacteria group bacterium]MBU1906596.1 hypothetical protein [Patescibacteria group bacterium]